jgi:hypothetical protein
MTRRSLRQRLAAVCVGVLGVALVGLGATGLAAPVVGDFRLGILLGW